MTHAPEQSHNHNLDSVTLNHSCPISRLRIINHNRTKCKENGTREQCDVPPLNKDCQS
jgi:hypothetical protein